MLRPVQVEPPAAPPIDAAAAMQRAPALADADASVVDALIKSVTDHLDGWSGTLGRCIVEQTWRQDFDCFRRDLRLPFLANTIVKVSCRQRDGQSVDVVEDQYRLITDGLGSFVRMRDGFSAPADLDDDGAVSVTYKTGFGAPDEVPEPIKQAIVLMVVGMYGGLDADGGLRGFAVDGAFSEQYNSPEMIGRINTAYTDMLLGPYRRVAV